MKYPVITFVCTVPCG